MLARVVPLLRCPHCGADLQLADRAVSCPNRHSFDVARQGYLNLLPGDARAGMGDTAAMVAARAAFLGAGHYGEIMDAVAAAAAPALTNGSVDGIPVSRGGGCCLELGAGTGHYLGRVLDATPRRTGLALDVSTAAARRSARAHPRMAAVVCDAWAPLPVRSSVAALVLSVFAPRNGPELARVLQPGGALVVVTPTTAHLAELVPTLGLISVDDRKAQRLNRQLDPFLSAESARSVERVMGLGHSDVQTLVTMGPSVRHTDPATMRERIQDLPDPMPVTASVTVSVYRRAGDEEPP
jgi:23S rRNA (guanine745-N1)-methyltransferase